jgi:O-Antigen ligase
MKSRRAIALQSHRSAQLAGAATPGCMPKAFAQGASKPSPGKGEVLGLAFFWLTAFYFVYCARPADLVPAFGYLRPAKVTGALATLSLLLSLGKTQRSLKDLPKEAYYLLLIVAFLFVSALLSPVWRGGAFFTTLDFAKVCVVWILTFLLVTTFRRLKRVIFLQSASVAAISLLAIVKGRSVPRLEAVIGGFYSNPNDMAFAIVLSVPFCVAFLLSARSLLHKAGWGLGIMSMAAALILTASRAGFIDLVVSGGVMLWLFAVRGRRPHLIAISIVLIAGLFVVSGKDLTVRFSGMFSAGNTAEQDTAYESFEERKVLMSKAIDAIVSYPILGVGAGDFVVYSGMWREVHASYLQMAADGGIPVLILYLLFFGAGFSNLRFLSKSRNLDDEQVLFVGALKSSLVGFAVGACFAPEAYQFFPYFAVCYSSVLVAIVREREPAEVFAGRPAMPPFRRSARAY